MSINDLTLMRMNVSTLCSSVGFTHQHWARFVWSLKSKGNLMQHGCSVTSGKDLALKCKEVETAMIQPLLPWCSQTKLKRMELGMI